MKSLFPWARGPLWITCWVAGLRRCSLWYSWQSREHKALCGQQRDTQQQREVGATHTWATSKWHPAAISLPWWEPSQHLPAQESPETHRPTRVLPQIMMKKHHHHQGESPGIGLCQTQTVTKSRTTKSSSLESTAQAASGCKTKAQAQIPSQTALPVV